MTPEEAYTLMQGPAGGVPGLTTYSESWDPATYETHQACEYLEAGGQARRYIEHYVYAPGSMAGQATRYVIWAPIAGAPPIVPPATWPPPPPAYIPIPPAPPPLPPDDDEAPAAEAAPEPPPA